MNIQIYSRKKRINRNDKKILKIIGIVIVSIGVVVLLFIKFWPSLGGRVTEDDQKEYKARNSL